LEERQHAGQHVLESWKSKTGYTNPHLTVHFSVGIGHFAWDERCDDGDATANDGER
jgi:hypothetical protein